MIKVWVLFIFVTAGKTWIIEPMEKFTSRSYCESFAQALRETDDRVGKAFCLDMDYNDAIKLKIYP